MTAFVSISLQFISTEFCGFWYKDLIYFYQKFYIFDNKLYFFNLDSQLVIPSI